MSNEDRNMRISKSLQQHTDNIKSARLSEIIRTPAHRCPPEEAYTTVCKLCSNLHFREGVPYATHCLANLDEEYGSTHPVLCRHLVLYATLFMALDRWDEAQECINRVFEIYAEHLPDEDLDSQARKLLARCHRMLWEIGHLRGSEGGSKDTWYSFIEPERPRWSPANYLLANDQMYQDSRREAQPLKPRVRVEVLPNPKMGAPTSNCTLVSAAGRFRAHLLPEVLEEVAALGVTVQQMQIHLEEVEEGDSEGRGEGEGEGKEEEVGGDGGLTGAKPARRARKVVAHPLGPALWYMCELYVHCQGTRLDAATEAQLVARLEALMRQVEPLQYPLFASKPSQLETLPGEDADPAPAPAASLPRTKHMHRVHSIMESAGTKTRCSVSNTSRLWYSRAYREYTLITLSAPHSPALLRDLFWCLREMGLAAKMVQMVAWPFHPAELVLVVFDLTSQRYQNKQVGSAELKVVERLVGHVASEPADERNSIMGARLQSGHDQPDIYTALQSEHQLAGEERECVRRALHRSVPEFLGLPTERDKDAALNMACVRVLPRGQTLLREGERAAHVCAVLDGSVILSSEGGESSSVAETGDTIGSLSITEASAIPATAVVMDPATVAVLSWRCFDFLQEALALQLRKHVLEAVLGAEVFEKLSIEQCQLLTNTCWQLNAHVHYPKGQTLIWSGEHIEKAYLIVQGKICVKDRDMVEVRTIHHHEVFGFELLDQSLAMGEDALSRSPFVSEDTLEAAEYTVLVGMTLSILERAGIAMDDLELLGATKLNLFTESEVVEGDSSFNLGSRQLSVAREWGEDIDSGDESDKLSPLGIISTATEANNNKTNSSEEENDQRSGASRRLDMSAVSQNYTDMEENEYWHDPSSAYADQSSAYADQSIAYADQSSAYADQSSAYADQSLPHQDDHPERLDSVQQEEAQLWLAELRKEARSGEHDSRAGTQGDGSHLGLASSSSAKFANNFPGPSNAFETGGTAVQMQELTADVGLVLNSFAPTWTLDQGPILDTAGSHGMQSYEDQMPGSTITAEPREEASGSQVGGTSTSSRPAHVGVHPHDETALPAIQFPGSHASGGRLEDARTRYAPFASRVVPLPQSRGWEASAQVPLADLAHGLRGGAPGSIPPDRKAKGSSIAGFADTHEHTHSSVLEQSDSSETALLTRDPMSGDYFSRYPSFSSPLRVSTKIRMDQFLELHSTLPGTRPKTTLPEPVAVHFAPADGWKVSRSMPLLGSPLQESVANSGFKARGSAVRGRPSTSVMLHSHSSKLLGDSARNAYFENVTAFRKIFENTLATPLSNPNAPSQGGRALHQPKKHVNSKQHIHTPITVPLSPPQPLTSQAKGKVQISPGFMPKVQLFSEPNRSGKQPAIKQFPALPSAGGQ